MTDSDRNILKEYIKKMIMEMSVTGAVAGYQTPFAFSRRGQKSNKATKASLSLGYVPVKKKKTK